MAAGLTDLSRAVSHALRHEPWVYELELDEEGWTPVDSVLVALRNQRTEWAELAEADLVRMIEGSAKRRHEIQESRIRALYGHSVAGKLRKVPAIPPSVLFHGTSPAVVCQVKVSGLLPMKRQYVHLSIDEATALEVGRRKTRKPVLLQVLSQRAHDKGVHFYEGNEKVWLADGVPPEFIEFP